MSGTGLRSYDYVIVGAGTAGCLLAERLSQDPDISVLVLEAGGQDIDPLISIPIGVGKIHEQRLHDWGYDTEIDKGLNGRSIESMRGKVVGGSSSINVMTHVRGNRGDYDRWAANGATGWGYADLLPYFRRYESWQGGQSDYRGGNGPLTIIAPVNEDPIFASLVEAGKAVGHPVTPDYNGAVQDGFGVTQSTIRDGRRCSGNVAFLRPALRRPKVSLELNALATKVILDGHRAIGLEYLSGGRAYQVFAEREVILSGGVFNTPHLLMLSGIGPADHLRETGITPVIDVPALGSNLQDHMAVAVSYERRTRGNFHALMRLDRLAPAMLEAYFLGKGDATKLPGGITAFLKTKPSNTVPDIQFFARGSALGAGPWFPGFKAPYTDGFSFTPVLLHPESRGMVRLRSTDPREKIRVIYNAFSEESDLHTLRDGVKMAREVVAQGPLDRYRGAPVTVGAGKGPDAEIETSIRNTARSAHHPSCTCPMGTGPDAVLDPELKLPGIEGLRVVDASAMPDLVTGNINACVLVIAEKAADLIRGRTLLPPAVGL